MNIAFFNKHLPSDQPNGVSIQVHRLANALVRMGHKLTCFSFSPLPADAMYNCHQFQWGNKPSVLRKFIPAFKFRSVDSKEFDIVHFHGDDYLCREASNRVRTFYGSAIQEALHAGSSLRFFYQALFYAFEWISCLKSGTLAGISKNTVRSLPVVNHVVPCGIPLDIYNPDNTTKSDNPSILFVGGLKGRKRGDLLVKIFQQNILPLFPDSILTIIGPQSFNGSNIICYSKLTESELIEQYRRHWIFCQPSSYEGFGVPILEAMACGTAVVSANNPGASEIISNGTDGFCCSKDSLSKCLIELIDNEKLRNQFSCMGLKTAYNYNIEKTALLYEKIYRSICKT